MKTSFSILAALVLEAALVCSARAAPPAVCEALRTRIRNLEAAIKRTTGKEAAARLQAERDRVSREYNARCPQPPARKTGGPSAPGVLLPQATGPGEELPEDEIVRRREMINQRGHDSGSGGDGRTMHAIPVEGTLLIEGGDSSTMYGKVKQELTYTIREYFVGNLIVTRVAGREDYALQTLSIEIDVDKFSGRGCAKYTGSPPVCSKWHPIDLWQIAEGEEYPGRLDGVVSLSSDGRAMIIRVDGPDIDFGSSEGPVTIRTGCSRSLRETVDREIFKQWLRRATIRIKREVGKTTPGCRPGSTLTLEMHIGPDS